MTTIAAVITGTHSAAKATERRLEVTGNAAMRTTAQARLSTGREGTREHPEAMEMRGVRTILALGASAITTTAERSEVTRREEDPALGAEPITATAVSVAAGVFTAAEAALIARLNNS